MSYSRRSLRGPAFLFHEWRKHLELSIVIVSYDTECITRKCLESVYANARGLDLGGIVVDNASSDASIEMINRRFPATVLIKNAENRGLAAANNPAFAIARGDVILLLNSDIVILGDALQRSLECLRRHSEAGAMARRALDTDHTVQHTRSEYPTRLNLLPLASGLDRLPWPKARCVAPPADSNGLPKAGE